MARGHIAIDQIEGVYVQGSSPVQIATTDGSYTTGNVPAYDSTGRLIDSGVAASSTSGVTPVLDASGNPIFDASGNWIFV